MKTLFVLSEGSDHVQNYSNPFGGQSNFLQIDNKSHTF